jgi:hypothetical protein
VALGRRGEGWIASHIHQNAGGDSGSNDLVDQNRVLPSRLTTGLRDETSYRRRARLLYPNHSALIVT